MADDRLMKLRAVAERHPDSKMRQWAAEQLTASQPGPARSGTNAAPMDLLGVEMERGKKQRLESKLAKGREEEAALRVAAERGWDPAEMADDAVTGGGALAMDWADGFTGGGASALLGLLPGQRQQVQQQRQTVTDALGDTGSQLARGTMFGLGATTPYGMGSVATTAGLNAQAMAKGLSPRMTALTPAMVASGVETGANAATRSATGEITPMQAAEETATGLAAGTGIAGGLATGGRAAGAVSNRVRNGRGTTGQDIRLLERHGAEPSPVPFRPVKNAPSKQLGIDATSEERGAMGQQLASKMQDEVESQGRALNRRFPAEMGPAMESQGGRNISVEALKQDVLSKLKRPEAIINKDMGAKLKGVLRYLNGETEDYVTAYPASTSKETSGPAAVFSKTESDPNFVPRARRVGNNAGANVVSGENVTADSVPIDVMMTDVRRRVGDAPNKVRTIEELNALRDYLDTLAQVEVVAAGGKMDKSKVPLAQVGSAIRDDIIAKEAPAVAHTNRRHHDAKRKLEVTEERMRTDNDESLGMQIASLGEEGSKISGARRERLGELREQFPVSDRLTAEEVRRGFDVPRLLLAEERLALKNIPRIGSGGKDVLNIAEPLLGRGVYPLSGFLDDALSGVTGAGHVGRGTHKGAPVRLDGDPDQRALPPLTLPVLDLLGVEEERRQLRKARGPLQPPRKKSQPTKE